MIRKFILLTLLLVGLATQIQAQCPRNDGGTACVCPGDLCVNGFGDPINCDPCPTCSFCSPQALAEIPIDQGVLALLVLGLAFGVRVVWVAYRNKALKSA